MNTFHMEPQSAEAFRLQCYRWMLLLDPGRDGSIQTESKHHAEVAACVRQIHAWLDTQYTDQTPIDDQTEAWALLTLYCGVNTTTDTTIPLLEIEERAYELLDRLPPSKLKTHLMAQISVSNEDPDLMDAVQSDIASWSPSRLTQEDHYLQSLLHQLSFALQPNY